MKAMKTLIVILCLLWPAIVLAQPSAIPPSDEAYNATTWDGVTSVAPSKNAVRDKIETLPPSTGSTSIVSYGPTALQSVSCTANALTLTPTAGLGIVNISVTQTGDANCAVTMAETGAVEGTVAIIKNISDGAAETLTFTTSSNVLRLIQGSPFVMGINETLILQYKGSEWLEIGRASGTIGISTLNLPSSDAAPSGTTGQVRHDTAVTNFTNGAVCFYDGSGVRCFLDSATADPITGKSINTPAVSGATDATNLTAVQVSSTVINSYGRAGAVTLNLPAAASGYSFVAIVGTKHNSAWKILRNGSDTIYADVGAGIVSGKTYIQETNQAVGSSIACYTFQTGASAYSWLCKASIGTWVTD